MPFEKKPLARLPAGSSAPGRVRLGRAHRRAGGLGGYLGRWPGELPGVPGTARGCVGKARGGCVA